MRFRSLAASLALALALPAAADARRIEKDVARLAADAWQGRRAGSAGADAAAEWIAEQFAAAGLAAGAADGSFFQAFDFVDGASLGGQNRLELGAGSRLELGRDFRPLSFSAAGAAAGELVFAGYGLVAPSLGRDDFAGLDVVGKPVLMLRYGPDGLAWDSPWAAFTDLRRKALNARARGAAAVLFVTGPRTRVGGDELTPLRQDASLRDVGLPVLALTRKAADRAFAGAGTSLDALQQAADAGLPASRALPVVARVEADLTPRRARTRNVIGLLPAPGAREVVVVGAHHDHLGLGASGSLDPSPDGKVHHGADDNASGTAGLLELARRLAPRASELERSLLFVSFGAEELGTLGSLHFVEHSPVPLERIVAMANLDMIGRLRGDVLQVHGVDTSPRWKPLVEQANVGLGLKLLWHEGGFGPSDHAPFAQAGKPVLFLFTGVHADYHRPSDVSGRIDERGIDRIVTLLERVLLGLAGR
ncbi:MAG: M28 family peptidase [Vicinamibacteria bacterium]|nr:M28 family peptidase [Vicinamibacteria bacterium]